MDLSADRPLDVLEATRKVNAITPEFDRPARIRPRLVANQPSGTIIIQSERVVIGYPGNTLFTARNLELKRGECAAMIGPNGSGKTTFLKVLLKQLDPLSGSIRLGASLRPGYFAQAQDNLNGENSILDELMAAKSMPAQEARSYLAKYLFKGEDVFKPVRALSGGERARLALAIMSLKGANFLLLDEPTNHLDIPAREALQEVLGEFEGTILLVSHDRYLVDKLATQIWSLQESQLICFKGTYREYILRGLDSSLKLNQREKPPVRQAALPEKPLFALNGRESRQRDQKLTMLEERIQEQEVMIRNLSIQLQKLNGPHAPVRIQELSSKIAQAQAVLDSLLTEWEKVA
jgi:ATP-binding cassette subfamily F protein 3